MPNQQLLANLIGNLGGRGGGPVSPGGSSGPRQMPQTQGNPPPPQMGAPFGRGGSGLQAQLEALYQQLYALMQKLPQAKPQEQAMIQSQIQVIQMKIQRLEQQIKNQEGGRSMGAKSSIREGAGGNSTIRGHQQEWIEGLRPKAPWAGP